MKKLLFILMAVFAVGIGLYPGLYFLIDRRFGLLQSKSEALLADGLWNAGFYTHIILGGVALLAGWSQFSSSLRKKRLSLHRNLGKVYVFSALTSSVAAIGIATVATGGWIAITGFTGLGVIWFSSTLVAYLHILKKDTVRHQEAMMYSYAACFAAVMLRIWLPLLTMWFGDFEPAYRTVAWLCWVPNLFVAHALVTQLRHTRKLTGSKG